MWNMMLTVLAMLTMLRLEVLATRASLTETHNIVPEIICLVVLLSQ